MRIPIPSNTPFYGGDSLHIEAGHDVATAYLCIEGVLLRLK